MPDAAPPPGRTHASGIFGVATYAVAKGIEREEVESVLGVSLHQLMDPKLWLPDHIPTTLCSTVLRARPDDAVPIELGMVFPVNDVIHAMQMAPTLADALRVFARFSVVAMANDAEVHFDNSPNFGAIHWFHPADKLDGGIMQGAVVAFLLRVIRGMTSSAPSVAEVRLSGDRVGLLPHYERYFGRAPRFHTPSPRGELVFPKADLERPLERGDAKLFALFWDLLETRLELISNLNPDPVEELRRRFADAVREGIPRIEHVVETSGMSLRSAQRLAASRGTSLRVIRDQELRAHAERVLLDHADLSIDDIGAELGYSDARSFNRAFKRLTGKTPATFRRVRSHSERS